jgi:adenylate kinase
MLNVVLFGPPGSGKGTQSERLIEKYELKHFSTGDILRNEIKNGTDLGRQAEEIMKKGELVSDDIVIGMIKNKIIANRNANGYIFDGFPRTVEQAKALDELMSEFNMSISGLVSLVVPNDELVNRLLKRGEETGRADDNLETIKNRINVYDKQTSPVATYYENQGKYYPVDGVGSIDDIFDRIEKAIEKIDE